MNVEFIGRHELAYGWQHRSIILPIETYIADDGAPDGVIVHFAPEAVWSNGLPLTREQYAEIMSDLQSAAIPLKTRFRTALEE